MSVTQSGAADVGATMTERRLEPTGVPNLDEVLSGGLPPGASILIIGPPGCGKTTLAAQLAFEQARNGKRALILTTLSESTHKLITHLRPFPFFDEGLLGGAVQVLSIEQFFPEGIAGTGDELAAMARSTRPGIVVIDGLHGIPGAEDTAAARAFLYRLSTLLGILGCLTVVTKEGEPRDPAMYPEATTTDVILGLHYRLTGVREQRWLDVVKTRGSSPLQGLHTLVLDANGVEIYPRLEARVRAALQAGGGARQEAERAARARPRAEFGIAALDALLGGGLPRATSTVVAGDIGTGKTTLALQFALEGVRRGEPAVWLSFRESRAQLLLKASFLGGDAAEAALAPGGGLALLEIPPVEVLPNIIAANLLSALDHSGARRAVIDSLTELVRVISANGDGTRVDEYLTALVVALRAHGITSLLTSELPPTADGQSSRTIEHGATMAENLLLLEAPEEGRPRRLLSIRTLRSSARDGGPHEFTIEPSSGIRF